MFRIGTYRSRNQQQRQQQQQPPPPPELLPPEASQPASQQHNDVNKPRINKSKTTKEREGERERGRERGGAHKTHSGEARRAGKLASAQRATLPPFCCLHATAEFTSSETTLIGWEIYFYSDIFIFTTLLVFPPTGGTPAIFFTGYKRYRQNAKSKNKKTNSRKQ